MGMRHGSVCKENRGVFSWCIKRWVCECFGETGKCVFVLRDMCVCVCLCVCVYRLGCEC